MKKFTFTSYCKYTNLYLYFQITIPPSLRKTFCHRTRIRSCILAFPLSVFHNLCCGIYNNSSWKVFLSAYGILLVYLSQAKYIQLRTYIQLLSLSYLKFILNFHSLPIFKPFQSLIAFEWYN